MEAGDESDDGSGREKEKGEKLLLPISPDGDRAKPVVAHVIDSLAGAGIMDEIMVLTSPANAPRTRAVLQSMYADDPGVRVADSDGAGYSRDLGSAMRAISERHGPAPSAAGADAAAGRECVMVVPGDMPLLDARAVLAVSDHHASDAWTSVMVSESYARMWDVNLEYSETAGGVPCYYTGVSMVGLNRAIPLGDMTRRHVILDDHRIAFTLNTAADYRRLRSFGL